MSQDFHPRAMALWGLGHCLGTAGCPAPFGLSAFHLWLQIPPERRHFGASAANQGLRYVLGVEKGKEAAAMWTVSLQRARPFFRAPWKQLLDKPEPEPRRSGPEKTHHGAPLFVGLRLQ